MGKDGKPKKSLSRKEIRKQERALVKQKKQMKHQPKVPQKTSAPGPLQKILLSKKDNNSSSKAPSKPVTTKAPPVHKDPYLEQEEMELARLSKLLGIDSKTSRKKAAERLNKEFDLFEGMGDGFGDFLMELDDLTDMVEGKSDRKAVFHGRDDDPDPASVGVGSSRRAGKFGGHLIDEDEQEASDIDDAEYDDSDGDGEDASEGDNDEDEDEDDEGSEDRDGEELEGEDSGEEDEESEDDDDGDGEGEGSEQDEEGSYGEGSQEYASDGEEENEEEDGSAQEFSEGEEQDGQDEDSDSEGDDKDVTAAPGTHIYRPTKGEDIYGRSTAGTDGAGADKPGKYVPPAKRKAALMEVDESSENVQLLRRTMNGLMNKLSDQSKDSIVRSIKALFDRNSVTVATLVLKDAIFAACAHPTQVMTSLIPTYAAVVAALHNSVSVDVGGTIVEHLTTALVKSLAEATAAAKNPDLLTSQSAGYIGTKLPANALLLLVYLYNLRVIHHTLIVDIMNALADHVPAGSPSTAVGTIGASKSSESGLGDFVELKVELLECLINHCGTSIRSDDPVSLKAVIGALSKRLSSLSAAGAADSGDAAGSSRLRFMFEALTDLKNNKSRRIQTSNAEVVKHLRKWLGAIKTALGQKQSGDTCLRVTLQDLLAAETKGRWWRTGASWVGKQQEDFEKEEAARKLAAATDSSAAKRAKTATEQSEEEQLLKLAIKMRMNTTTRKNIFVVMMSSRDVTDAFERLSRLELKGKEDREVARVLAQCCAQERTYNPFYAELAKTLCTQHRQYKITFQFVFWDAFKAMQEEEDEEGEAARLRERKAVNLARLMAALVCSFHLPLTVVKPIDISNMSASIILFLSTLLLALFKDQISDEEYQTLLDRVATSKDFAVVRDNLLFFLQKYLHAIPKGLDPADSKKMAQRRKVAIKTFEAMSVLDIAKGAMKEEDLDD